MSDIIYYGSLGAVLVASALGYFLLARKFGIVDKPNERSSHRSAIIRGGGILFPVAGLIWWSSHSFQHSLFFTGLLLLTLVSFSDDVRPQHVAVRLFTHLAAMVLAFYQVSLFDWPLWLLALAFIVSVGALSAFNFMDGINGITGVYALVSLATFYIINNRVTHFVDNSLLATFGMSVLIFLFFNFRKKAMCFAGDVGSITIAYIQIFLLLELVVTTGNLWWVLLFLVYGIDTIATILMRLGQRENIFRAHRKHLYQILANEKSWDHRVVTIAAIGVPQVLINAVVVFSYLSNTFWGIVMVVFLYLMGYILARKRYALVSW